MRRLFIVALMVFVGLVALPTTASAQFDFSKLGGLLGGSSTKTTKSPYTTLTENAPAKSRVLGEWSYSSIDVEYLGTNSFAGASISQLNGSVNAELKSLGIVPGCFTITLQSNGKGSFCFEEDVYEGRYTYDSAKARFTLTATAENGKTITCSGFLKMNNGKLGMMLKAEDALSALATAVPEIATDSTFVMIKSIVDSFSGIYITMYYAR